MQMLSGKGQGASVLLKTQTISNLSSLVMLIGVAAPSRVMKVSGVIDVEQARYMPSQELEDLLDDLMSEFKKFGTILDAFIIKADKASIGAEPGAVFIMYAEKEHAEGAMREMTGKKFNSRELKLIFLNEETFNKHFAYLR
jgi:arginyl-tRNA--protein-N-Asp/Glu arginylyltransferase